MQQTIFFLSVLGKIMFCGRFPLVVITEKGTVFSPTVKNREAGNIGYVIVI